ncbi:MAG: M48 family metallopeptidase [Rhodospirillales bacterium]|nr:M48 family metallopeptidase [Rhodospirillales bacterium]
MAGLSFFRRARRKPKPIREERTVVELDGRDVPLCIRHHPRARRMTLRVDPVAGGAVVTLPDSTPADAGVDMVRRKAGWLIGRLEALPPRSVLADGATVPLLGAELTVRHHPEGRGVVRREGDALIVTGRPEHLPRRLTDWLKAEARREFAARARIKAEALGRRMGKVTVRDTRTRWGSCSANGNLSFCWRLMLAPPFVVDYVVAHEIAHLAVRDHSPRFWKTVATLTKESDRARAWLNRHGEALHRFG